MLSWTISQLWMTEEIVSEDGMVGCNKELTAMAAIQSLKKYLGTIFCLS
jgi:hypothetical protein